MRHCRWSLHLIINSCVFFFRSSCFHWVHIHYLLFIDEHYWLLFAWIIAYVLFEFIDDLVLTCEQNHGWEIFLALRFIILRWSRLSKATVELLIVYDDLKFVYTSWGCFAIVPYFHCTYCFRFVKYYAHIVRYTVIRTLQSLGLLLGSSWCHCLVWSCIFKWSQPHIVFVKCLVFTIHQVLDHSNVTLHSFKLMHALWFSNHCAWFE